VRINQCDDGPRNRQRSDSDFISIFFAYMYSRRMPSSELEPAENQRVKSAILQLLKKYGGNQSELARRLGVRSSTISQGVSGKNGASLSLAKAVAKELGIEWPELLTGTKPTSSHASTHAERMALVYTVATQALGIPRGVVRKVQSMSPVSPWQAIDLLRALGPSAILTPLPTSDPPAPFAERSSDQYQKVHFPPPTSRRYPQP
jgi:transcriptional regulator with XRE-family HTH domain